MDWAVWFCWPVWLSVYLSKSVYARGLKRPLHIGPQNQLSSPPKNRVETYYGCCWLPLWLWPLPYESVSLNPLISSKVSETIYFRSIDLSFYVGQSIPCIYFNHPLYLFKSRDVILSVSTLITSIICLSLCFSIHKCFRWRWISGLSGRHNWVSP